MPGTNQTPEWKGVEAALRTQQVLVGALLAGLLSFTGVVLALQTSGSITPPPSGTVPENAMLIAMGVLTLVTMIASFVMRRVIVGKVRNAEEQGEESDEQALVMRMSALTVLRAALAEGPALFATVIVMITGNMMGFAGTAVGVLVLLAIFPTRGKFDAFVRDATGRAPGL